MKRICRGPLVSTIEPLHISRQHIQRLRAVKVPSASETWRVPRTKTEYHPAMIDLLQYCASIAAPSTKVNSAFGLQPQSYIIRVGEPRPALPICSILSKPMRDLFPSKGSDVDCQSFGMFSILVVNPRDERNGLALKSCSGGLLSLYIYFDFCRLSGRHHTELVLIKPVGRVRRKK